MSTLVGLRYGKIGDKRFVARDRMRGSRPHPEHAEWVDGRVRWYPHLEGGMMRPFTGPVKIYEQLCEGGRQYLELGDEVGE